MSSLNYIAILGRQPELGLVELESLVGAKGVQIFGRQAALVGAELDVDRLGGVLKFAQVLYRGPVTPLRDLPVDVASLPVNESKTSFGISAYGLRDTPKMLAAAGLELKKQLKVRGSVRLVLPARGLALSAAELRHNAVVRDGFELVVVVANGEMVVAKTLGVQDIDWYSKRDYDRPARSAKVGMLPPKLAQVLVNTTSASKVVDPFCGTGVVLQEARLLGREAAGSDLSGEMVDATRTNMVWLDSQVSRALPAWAANLADARAVVLEPDVSIVSEGYLGPNLSHSPALPALGTIKSELLALYRDCFRNWAKQLPAGAQISICVPAWRVGKVWHYLGLVDELASLGYTLKSFRAAQTPLLYARDDQVVGRQLLLLRKN